MKTKRKRKRVKYMVICKIFFPIFFSLSQNQIVFKRHFFRFSLCILIMILNSTSNDKQNSKTTINKELSSTLEIDISFNKILFNFPLKPTDSEIENLKHTFSNYIQSTKNNYKYFLGLLKHFATIRPKHKHIVPKLYETIISNSQRRH